MLIVQGVGDEIGIINGTKLNAFVHICYLHISIRSQQPVEWGILNHQMQLLSEQFDLPVFIQFQLLDELRAT